jgi:imidazolonepropionase-like amidohydrolase
MVRLRSSMIVDGTGAQPFAGSVSISGSQIVRVQPVTAEHDDALDDDESIDLTGYTILPGLIDAHTHIGSVVQPHGVRPKSLAVIAAQIFSNLERAVNEGFTTVRELSGLDGGASQAAELGLIVAPRILPSGPMMGQSCGHGDWRPEFGHGPWTERWPGLLQASVIIDGVDEAQRVARMALRDGASQLKVALSGGFSSEFDSLHDIQFSASELAAIVEVARARDTYVTGHAHNSAAIRHGLRAGVECFEHATFADQATLEEVARYGASIVATLSILARFRDTELRDSLSPELQALADSAVPTAAAMVKSAISCGVTVGLGTDMNGVGQRFRARELTHRALVTDPLEAIAAATGKNAKILRVDDDRGTLTQGLLADLVVLDGDPIATPTVFDDPERIRLVVMGGTVYRNTLPHPLAADVTAKFQPHQRR